MEKEGPLPLVIGVAGHRDLSTGSDSPLRAGLKAFFTDLAANLPNTPLLLLVPMQAGAGTLAVDEALACGVRIFGILPEPRDQYEAGLAQSPEQASYLALCEKLRNQPGGWCVVASDDDDPAADGPASRSGRSHSHTHPRPAVAASESVASVVAQENSATHALPSRASVLEPEAGGPVDLGYLRTLEFIARHSSVLLVLGQGEGGVEKRTGASDEATSPSASGFLETKAAIAQKLGRPVPQVREVRERHLLIEAEGAMIPGPVYEIWLESTVAQPGAGVSSTPPVRSGYIYPGTRHSAGNQHDSGSAFEAMFERVRRELEAFNRVAVARAEEPGFANAIEGMKEQLWPRSGQPAMGDPEDESTPLIALTPSEEELLRVCAFADFMAGAQKNQARTEFIALILVAGSAVLSLPVFHLAEQLSPEGAPWLFPWGAMLAFGLFGLGIGAVYLWRRHLIRLGCSAQDRHENYRGLAEALRVQFYWSVADLRTSAAYCYLAKQVTELEWVRRAVDSLYVINLVNPDAPANVSSGDNSRTGNSTRLSAVAERWIWDQAKWLAKAAGRDERAEGRWHRAVIRIMGGAAGVALAAVVSVFALWRAGDSVAVLGHPITPDLVSALSIFLIHCLLVVAGACHLWKDRMALGMHARHLEHLRRHFEEAYKHLMEALNEGAEPEKRDPVDHRRAPHDNLVAARHVLREVGREALAENGDWVMLHREHPLEVLVI